jgi:hypothetical protein
MDPTIGNLSSAAGVVTLTLFLVALLKPYLARAPKLSTVPTWIYTIGVAVGLTLLANLVFKTLPGDWRQLLLGVINGVLAAGARNIAANVGTTVQESHGSNEPSRFTFGGSTPLIALLILFPVFAGGCTSKPFTLGVSQLGPVLANHAADYAGRDPSLPELDRAQRLGQAMKLQAVTSDVKAIDVETTAAAWTPVKPWLSDYSEHDPAMIADPYWLLLRRGQIQSMDTLIDAERRRRAILLPPIYLPPATQPVH